MNDTKPDTLREKETDNPTGVKRTKASRKEAIEKLRELREGLK